MLRFGNTKNAKEELYGPKKTTKIWEVNIDTMLISKLIE